MVTQPSALAAKLPGRIFFPGRSASLSSQIIADVRDALFAKQLKPGDVLGTENEIASRYGVSRIVPRHRQPLSRRSCRTIPDSPSNCPA